MRLNLCKFCISSEGLCLWLCKIENRRKIINTKGHYFKVELENSAVVWYSKHSQEVSK